MGATGILGAVVRFRIRAAVPSDASRIAAVHVAGWNENYRGILDDRTIDERTVEVRTTTWTNVLADPANVTFLACTEHGEAVGFANGLLLSDATGGFESYLQALYLRSAVKRLGLGSRLVGEVVSVMLQRGAKNMALRVLTRNTQARAFYERLGARLIESGFTAFANPEWDECVYGFDDLRALRLR
jgi:ribosomal protein S18 acetylase RimI-like enzyme